MRVLLRIACVLLGVALIAPGLAHAQVTKVTHPTDAVVRDLSRDFGFGKYQDVLNRARAELDRGGILPDQRIRLHLLAGFSAFHLGQSADAERHFVAVLKLDPDHDVDPFEHPAPLVSFFEGLKKRLEPELAVIREQKRVEAERLQREADDRTRRLQEEEERRRRMEDLSRRVTIRNVEKRSFLVNFVPFGAGQFQQERTGTGVVLAAGQGAMALTSIIAYLAHEGLHKETHVDIPTPWGTERYTRRGIPPDRMAEARTWTLVKYISAASFYALYGYGVVDAIYHHEDEVVTTTTVQLPPESVRPRPQRTPETPTAPPDEPTRPQPRTPEEDTVPVSPSAAGSVRSSRLDRGQVEANYYMFPTPGGLGAGLTLQF